jgi:hypothetical protein
MNLAQAFPDPLEHRRALQATLRQLRLLPRCQPGRPMRGPAFTGWRRHAFESAPQRRGAADLRIVYRLHEDGRVEVLGFGHRWRPAAIYARLLGRASPEQSPGRALPPHQPHRQVQDRQGEQGEHPAQP